MKKLKLLILGSLTLLLLSSTCKQTTDCCYEAKFFEQSLGSRKETVEICYMTIDAMMFNCGTVDYPTVKLTINNDEGFVIDHDGKRYFQRLLYGFVDVNSITLQPILNEGEQMLFRSIELNSFKLNQPEGWNITIDDGVEYLGNTYFLMNHGSTIKFEKQFVDECEVKEI